jgi:hypothetical protein
MRSMDPRRMAPRVRVDGLCGLVSRDQLRHAVLLDLSALGVRIERLFDPALATRIVQLEIELPGTDEIVWARGEVTFAQLTPLGGRHPDGQPRLRCRAGVRIDRIAGCERRLLRDYVIETRRAQRVASAATDVAPRSHQEEVTTWTGEVALAACGT